MVQLMTEQRIFIVLHYTTHSLVSVQNAFRERFGEHCAETVSCWVRISLREMSTAMRTSKCCDNMLYLSSLFISKTSMKMECFAICGGYRTVHLCIVVWTYVIFWAKRLEMTTLLDWAIMWNGRISKTSLFFIHTVEADH